MDNVKIPDKLYFKIGEVAEITGIKTHVLRYWESEFSSFRPAKSQHKQRLYQRKDIELVLRLKELLYSQGYTIAGAKKKLREPSGPGSEQIALPLETGWERRLLSEIRNDLQKLKDSIDSPA